VLQRREAGLLKFSVYGRVQEPPPAEDVQSAPNDAAQADGNVAADFSIPTDISEPAVAPLDTSETEERPMSYICSIIASLMISGDTEYSK
jgi:hypothetical protein